MNVKLRIIANGEERFHEVRAHESVVLFGRHSTCDVVLDSEKRASRQHCRIEKTDAGYFVRDLESSNGTLINGLALSTEPHPLKLGDKIVIGETTVYFGEPVPVRKVARAADSDAMPPAAAVNRANRAARAEAALADNGLANPNFIKNLVTAAVVLFVVGLLAIVVIRIATTPPNDGGNHTASADPLEQQRNQRARDAAFDEFRRLRNSVKPLPGQIKDIREFASKNAFRPFSAEVNEWVSKYFDDLPNELMKRLSEAVRQANEKCNADEYGHAMQIMHRFYQDHNDDELLKFTEWAMRWNEVAQEIRRKASDFLLCTLVHEANDFLRTAVATNDPVMVELAQAVYETAIKVNYVGMDTMVNECRNRIEKIAGAENARRAGDVEVARRLADEAAQTSRQRVQRNSAQPQAGSGSGSSATPPPATGMSRSRERDLLDALHKAFIDACNREGRELKAYRLLWTGEERPIVGASESKGISLMMRGVQMNFGWERVQKETLLQGYLNIMRLTIDEEWAIAIFAFEINDRATAEDVLYNMLQKNPALKTEIDHFLARKRGMEMPDGGFIAYKKRGPGQFITPAEKEGIEIAERVEELTQVIEKNIGATTEARQQQVQQAIEELKQFGPEARRKAVEIINERKKREMQQLERMGFGGNSRLDRLKKELDEARAEALRRIFDEQRYPYPYVNKAEEQAWVDEAVNKVKEIWNNPAGAVGNVDRNVARIVETIKNLLDLARQVDPDNQVLSGNEETEFLDWAKSLANKKLDIKNYATTGAERGQYADYDQIERDNNLGESDATASERQHVSIVNAYRHMMGRRALRINSKLVLSSRSHSNYMKSSGRFAHDIPGHPDGTSPQDRARKFGYGSGVGENIAMASGGHSPQSAFTAWYNSSGHHRNMLNDRWRVMGVGDGGSHWTQMFGPREDGTEPREPRR